MKLKVMMVLLLFMCPSMPLLRLGGDRRLRLPGNLACHRVISLLPLPCVHLPFIGDYFRELLHSLARPCSLSLFLGCRCLQHELTALYLPSRNYGTALTPLCFAPLPNLIHTLHLAIAIPSLSLPFFTSAAIDTSRNTKHTAQQKQPPQPQEPLAHRTVREKGGRKATVSCAPLSGTEPL